MIDCEALLNHCWLMLNRKYEEAYGVRNYRYHKPEFTFVLSSEQIIALRRHIASKDIGAKLFLGIDKNMLFGHPFVEQQSTPYLQAVI